MTRGGEFGAQVPESVVTQATDRASQTGSFAVRTTTPVNQEVVVLTRPDTSGGRTPQSSAEPQTVIRFPQKKAPSDGELDHASEAHSDPESGKNATGDQIHSDVSRDGTVGSRPIFDRASDGVATDGGRQFVRVKDRGVPDDSDTRSDGVRSIQDPDGFVQSMDELRGDLFRHAMRMVRNPYDADDMVQDTLLKAWKARDTFADGSNFRAWVHRICQNTSLDFLRRQNRIRMDVTDTLPEPRDAYVQATVIDEEMETSWDLRGRLRDVGVSDPFADAVVLQQAGYSYDEIGDALGIKVGTVRSRLHRGHNQIRDSIEEIVDDPSVLKQKEE